MNKICTNLEQSKQLQSLGLSADTADMWWVKHYLIAKNQELDKPSDDEINDVFPVWSLSALLNLIPNENDNGRNYCYIEVYVGYYTVSYCNNWDGRILSTKSNKCLLDAAFEMVCYLLENKMIQYGTGK